MANQASATQRPHNMQHHERIKNQWRDRKFQHDPLSWPRDGDDVAEVRIHLSGSKNRNSQLSSRHNPGKVAALDSDGKSASVARKHSVSPCTIDGLNGFTWESVEGSDESEGQFELGSHPTKT